MTHNKVYTCKFFADGHFVSGATLEAADDAAAITKARDIFPGGAAIRYELSEDERLVHRERVWMS